MCQASLESWESVGHGHQTKQPIPPSPWLDFFPFYFLVHFNDLYPMRIQLRRAMSLFTDFPGTVDLGENFSFVLFRGDGVSSTLLASHPPLEITPTTSSPLQGGPKAELSSQLGWLIAFFIWMPMDPSSMHQEQGLPHWTDLSSLVHFLLPWEFFNVKAAATSVAPSHQDHAPLCYKGGSRGTLADACALARQSCPLPPQNHLLHC